MNPLAILLYLLGALQADPRAAIYLVSALYGRPDLAKPLTRVCVRETAGCRPMGVHARDAHLSRRGWRGQVRLGHLDPACQPYQEGAWATRGPLGLSAASAWLDMPRCYQPEHLDITVVSVYVALRRWERVCEDPRRRDGWCRVGRSRKGAP